MQPKLALAYDSGAGNGPFGLGWALSAAAITCKTDKGLPRYIDSGPHADVYVLSGAEDLVPVLDADASWAHPAPIRTLPDGRKWVVERFRPRVERLFARIELWTPDGGGAAHWRSISKDGVTSLYGTSDESRVVDPADKTRVFSWLLCETYDQKGNAMLFRYVAEDSARVNTGLAHERNRTPASRGAGRYLKCVRYGNATPNQDGEDLTGRTDWLFELVLDYGEHNQNAPKPDDAGIWDLRDDPFSTYRSRFDVRTYRLCRRILMFHHFPNESGVGKDCLVRSLELGYDASPLATKLVSITQSGHRRQGAGYLTRSFPPVEFAYSEPELHADVNVVDAENLPQGIGGAYRLVDLDGEGLPGIVMQQDGGWYYKRNLSPLTLPPGPGSGRTAVFGPLEREPDRPSISNLAGGQQLMDVDGDGQIELVQLDPPLSGFHSRTSDGSWEPFKPFASMPNLPWRSPNLRFADLTGDGQADAFITEDCGFRWHGSLGALGFGEEERASQPFDEERGPRLVFADGTQSVYLADLSGDGLSDLVRVRNGEVCYWPNTGYGTFGAKVTMDNSPVFDAEEAFDQRRVRLADVDGSGPADLVYVGPSGIQLYSNQAGNSFASAEVLNVFPELAELTAVSLADLLGNGTSCLVWSSALPGNSTAPLRYVDLMGGTKPHLLARVANNLGVETVIEYAASTKFYVQDRAVGRPWITRLPVPVHVVERVEAYDRISHNRFVTRYAYHHGYFDPAEREFRGFGCVDQLDTEEFAAFTAGGTLPAANADPASHVPPVRITTWFHTGAYLDGASISKQLEHEYYREGDRSDGLSGLTDAQAAAMELADTVLPDSILKPNGSRQPYQLTPDEEREACRALKGSIMRQEVYGLDGSDAEDRPYSVSKRNYTLEMVQPRGANQHAVFAPHARESLQLQYERALYQVGPDKVADPRVTHSFTFGVDYYGNVGMTAAVAYGRRRDDAAPELSASDRAAQRALLATYTTFEHTNSIEDPDAYRAPELYETNTYELIKAKPGSNVSGVTNLFRFKELASQITQASDGSHDVPIEDVEASAAVAANPYRRLVQRARIVYRKDDLSAPLQLGRLAPLALEHESYRLCYTQGMIASVFVRRRPNGTKESLIPDPAATLSGDGGYVRSGDLKALGIFPTTDADDDWWSPSGRELLSPGVTDSAAAELAFAQAHFYRPCRQRDPLGQTLVLIRDRYDLLMKETRDALGNRITAGTRNPNGTITSGNDYRILAPTLVTDPNGNRAAALFDAHGLVTATAVMGKSGESAGDSLTGMAPDVSDAVLETHLQDPLTDPHSLLGTATTRIVYDAGAYYRTRGDAQPQPVAAYALGRETHDADLAAGQETLIRHRFTYTDGSGRELQHKAQAAPHPRGSLRWVGSGWSIRDNKDNVVREYEPFFSSTHRFEFARQVGVSHIRLYDALSRNVATIHPDHTWEKTVMDPWRTDRWDANDTVLVSDPATDSDVGGWISRLTAGDYLPTWYSQRAGGGLGSDEQAAATNTAVHRETPGSGWVDARGREIVTLARNRYLQNLAPVEEVHATRTSFNPVGDQLAVTDARGRICQRTAFDASRQRVRTDSMDAGARWTLTDALGKTIRAWDSRGHTVSIKYDELRRPLEVRVLDAGGTEKLVQALVYGESQPNPEAANLRMRAFEAHDCGGTVRSGPYDFKGNLLRATRILAAEYRSELDWSQAVAPGDTFVNETTFDAQNRPLVRTTPDGSTLEMTYDEAGLPRSIEGTKPGAAQSVPFVKSFAYDAHGQRTSVLYGNGVSTSCTYDPLTLRPANAKTSRGAAFPGDCPNPGTTPCGAQNLSYTYDAVGNVVSIRDDAQQTIFFRGRRVEPGNQYVYDAVYRLIESRGREHLGQTAAGVPLPPAPTSAPDAPRVGVAAPTDGGAMGTYNERYAYDAVGNITSLVHHGDDPVQPGWRRDYTYADASALDPADDGNRLSSFSVSGGPANPLTYDAHGNTQSMPSLPVMAWDYADRLHATSQQVVNAGTPETTYYVYDSGGQRIRKVTEGQAAAGAQPTRTKERIYAGPYEVYREYDGSGTVVTLERQTLRISDESGLIALIETRTQGVDPSPAQLVRYQLNGHLGSSLLELADNGSVISYEEYYPYGVTAYQAVSGQTGVPKRYRWSGKERDEESGLYYFVARYYAPWLGRWTAADPAGLVDGPNLYLYARANPSTMRDPTGLQSQDDPSHQAANAAAGGAVVVKSVTPQVPTAPQSAATPILRTPPSAFAQQRPPPMTGPQARQVANQGAANYRAANGMVGQGPTVQAGHSITARDAPASGVTGPEMNNPNTILQVPSRIDPNLRGTVTDQSNVRTLTNHNVHEVLNDQAVDQVRAANGGTLTADGHVEAGHQVPWQTDNVPLDQRNVNYVRNSGRASNPGPLVNPQTGEVMQGPLPPPEPPPAVPAGPPPQLRSQLPPAELPPSGWTRFSAGAAEFGIGTLKVLGAVATVYGAANEAQRTYELEMRNNRGELNATLMGLSTAVVGVYAGVVDDALAAATVEIGSAPVIDSYQNVGAGPAQHLAGEAIRAFLDWGAHNGL